MHALRQLKTEKWSLQKFNGTQVKIEQTERVAESLHFTDLFSGYRSIWIEEVDQVPTVAQVRFLTLLDDLPRKTAVIATSNCKLKNLEERFQRRFTVLEVKPPTEAEIAQFLQTRFGLSEQNARSIAALACGNVGQALMDATGACVANRIAKKAV